MAGKVILLALRTALAWTFIHAGALKIWDFGHAQPATQDFVVAIQQYHLLPSPDLAVLLAIGYIEAQALKFQIPRFCGSRGGRHALQRGACG